MVRVAQRLLVLGAGVWWNWQIGAPEKRLWLPMTTEPPSDVSKSIIQPGDLI